MKTHEEMYDSVLRRRDEYEVKKAKRNKAIISMAASLCSLAIVICGVTLYSRDHVMDGGNMTVAAMDKTEDNTADTYETLIETVTISSATGVTQAAITQITGSEIPPEISPTIKDVTSTTAPLKNTTAVEEIALETTEGKAEAGYMAGDSDGALPYLNGLNIAIKGETITDAELKTYIQKNAEYMVASVAFDLGSGEYKVCTKGYSPLTVSTKDGLFVNAGFVDCPITKDGKIVAVVTVYKDKGVLYDSVAYGGEGFKTIQKAFEENPNDELVFIYVNEAPEVIITKNNKLYFITAKMGYNKNYDYYSLYKQGFNTFSQKDIDNNSVTVTV